MILARMDENLNILLSDTSQLTFKGFVLGLAQRKSNFERRKKDISSKQKFTPKFL